MNKNVRLMPRRFYWCLYLAGFFSLLSLSNPIFIIIVGALGIFAFKARKNGSCDSIDLNLNTINNFSTDEYTKIQKAHESISSFAEVTDWDLKASAQILEIENFHKNLSLHKEYLKSKIDDYRKERESGNFIERIFKYHTKERVIFEILNELQKVGFEQLMSHLRQQIEFSPNNLDEKNAEISNRFFSNPKSRRLDRQSNKYEKEQALAELEANKNQIIDQIALIDRQIAWVKQIGGKQKLSGSLDISSIDKTKLKAS